MYHSLLRLSGAKGCCFRKVFRGLPPNVMCICRPFSYSTQCCVNSEHLSSFTPPFYLALGVFFGLIGFLFLFASTSSVFFSSYFNQSYISQCLFMLFHAQSVTCLMATLVFSMNNCAHDTMIASNPCLDPLNVLLVLYRRALQSSVLPRLAMTRALGDHMLKMPAGDLDQSNKGVLTVLTVLT